MISDCRGLEINIYQICRIELYCVWVMLDPVSIEMTLFCTYNSGYLAPAALNQIILCIIVLSVSCSFVQMNYENTREPCKPELGNRSCLF